jgi:hypothetical protein
LARPCPHVGCVRFAASFRRSSLPSRSLIAYSIFSVAYGYRPKSDNEELLVMIKKMMEDFAVFAAPGNFLVDNIPICTFQK